jgi:pyridoxine 5-phosphate synthase
VYDLKPVLTTEFNIEGNPIPEFIKLVKEIKPAQVTLVPDAHDALTSNAGWDTKKHLTFLQDVVGEFQAEGIRVSIFVDTELEFMEYAAKTGTDRVELYTEPYAANFHKDRQAAVAPFVETAKLARQLGLGLNAGHDLNLDNLAFLKKNIPWLMEVSIGHALIADALYLGLEETIKRYKEQLAP